MIRLNPASRACLLAAGLVAATTTMAVAQDAVTVTETKTETTTETVAEPEEKFLQTIYFGPSFGYADQIDGEFGWAFHALMRPIEYLGLQIEYVNLGSDAPPDTSGENDGVYFGVAPMFPVMPRLDIFGQIGFAIGDAGDDVAAGAGIMYQLPIDWLDKINVDMNLMAQYKYFNWADGEHLVTFGILFGVHK
jgi:hypothetical protein